MGDFDSNNEFSFFHERNVNIDKTYQCPYVPPKAEDINNQSTSHSIILGSPAPSPISLRACPIHSRSFAPPGLAGLLALALHVPVGEDQQLQT